MDLKDIKAIVDLMKKNSISEFEMEKEDFKIKLKRGLGGSSAGCSEEGPYLLAAPQVQHALPPTPQAGAGAPPPASPAESSASAATAAGLNEITSPMIGTFYQSPSPDSPHFVEVGTTVTPDTVVCIIEAMKVMNEIKAETHGVIAEILIDNAKPVEYGQPLFRVKPR